jgi:hypothetical protein
MKDHYYTAAGRKSDLLYELAYVKPANHMYRHESYIKSRKTYTHAEAIEATRTSILPTGEWVSVGEIYHVFGNDPE